MKFKLISTTAAVIAWAMSPLVVSAETTRTIASYPSGTFLENLVARPDGSLLVTSYLDRSLLVWSGTDAPQVLVTLGDHPVAVLARQDDIILTVHGQSFTEGPSFTQTNAFVILNPDGTQRERFPAADALFLNGLVEIEPGVVLAADSLAGKIWQFDPVTGNVSEWLSDPMLTTNPAATGQSPGANGLKRHEDWLYVSNSSRQALYRVALNGNVAAGPLEPFAQTGPIDDFAFLSDGTIAAASHNQAVIGITADGTVSTLLAEGCDACTALLPFGEASELIVLTTGNLLEGGTEAARIFAIPSPVRN